MELVKVMEEKYVAYTDGACSNNQAAGGQPGGWGVVFLDGRRFSGGDQSTTNNRMELMAAIEALNKTSEDSTVDIYSDSAYLVNAFLQNWLDNWIKRNWKTSQGKPVENQDLWNELIKLEKDRKVNWIKIKGHSGDKWNELADRLAVEAIPSKETKNTDNGLDGESSLKRVSISLTKKEIGLILTALEDIAFKDADINLIYQKLHEQIK